MAANDLYASLSRIKPEAGWRFQLGWKLPFAFGCGLVAIIAGWALVMKDPLGGEPRRVALIAPPSAPVSVAPPDAALASTPKTIVAANGGGVEPATAPPDENTISIITPGGANGQMQVRHVAVPAAPKVDVALAPAPDPRLVEKSRHGLLPRIAGDGAKPSVVYARPSQVSGGARIAILVGGLGLSQAGTREAGSKLPPEVSFAFAPYGSNLQAQVGQARAQGHEVLLQLPMEPFDYPTSDPGPHTLLAAGAREQNLDRVHWLMSRFSGYTGVSNYMGAKFSSSAAPMRLLLQELKARGLIYAEDGSLPRSLAPEIASEIGVGHQSAYLSLDDALTPEKIDEALSQLENQALRTGIALASASALPITIERLARWAKTLPDKNISLVPVSAIIPVK